MRLYKIPRSKAQAAGHVERRVEFLGAGQSV
jgi:hypothetical protein